MHGWLTEKNYGDLLKILLHLLQYFYTYMKERRAKCALPIERGNASFMLCRFKKSLCACDQAKKVKQGMTRD